MATTNAAAGEAERPLVRVVRTEIAPKIDGRLDDAAWESAGLIPRLRQKVPVAYAEASAQTEIRILYDDDFLYIGVRAFDATPEKVIARKMVRDGDMSGDDRIKILRQELEEGAEVWSEVSTTIDGQPATVLACKKWGIVALGDRLLALDKYPLIALHSLGIRGDPAPTSGSGPGEGSA